LANSKSALKHIKTSEKRRLRNRAVKSTARTYVRQARTAIRANPTETEGSVGAAISALDRAAQKGVIHRNNAARRKSRLVKMQRQAAAQG
jgi:small subunit ribosomal protein S20